MATITLSLQARQSIQQKMGLILDAAQSNQPADRFLTLLQKKNTDQNLFLPLTLQSRLCTLFAAGDLANLQSKVKEAFSHFYGAEVLEAPAPKKPEFTFKIVDKCTWPLYLTFVQKALECGFSSEALKFIIPVQVEEMQFILIGEKGHHQPYYTKFRQWVQVESGSCRFAYFNESVSRDAIHESNQKVMLGLKPETFLFGLEAPHSKCVGHFVQTFNEATEISQTGAQGTYSLNLFFQMMLEQLLICPSISETWEAFGKEKHNEAEGYYQVYTKLSTLNKTLKSLPIEQAATLLCQMKISIPIKGFIELNRCLALFALKKHEALYTREQCLGIRAFLSREEKGDAKKSQEAPGKKQNYVGLVLEDRDYHSAYVLLSPPINLPNIPRVGLMGSGHLNGVLGFMHSIIEKALAEDGESGADGKRS
jgi:hypothetical protein